MDKERIKQLSSMTSAQRRELDEKLVASLVCAAYSLENFTEFKVVGRPKAPETHDFDAKRSRGKKMLAIEVAGLHGTNLDSGIFNPQKRGFGNKLASEIRASLEGKLRGKFGILGVMGDFPTIPGKKRQAWVQTVQQEILKTASTMNAGEEKPLSSPPEIANMKLLKVCDDGSKVDFIPITGGGASPNNAIEEFCNTTLLEKNNCCLATAKRRGKQTIMAVAIRYLPAAVDIKGTSKEIRDMYLQDQIPNIDHVYLVNRWEGGIDSRLIRVF